MENSFARLGENQLTRKFGGTLAGVADPYLTGYHFIYFRDLPADLGNFTNGIDNNQTRQILTAACTGVTPPGGTLNKVEFTGLGGIKWAVPGNIDYGNEVSVKFIEFNKTPLLNIFHGWFKLIRDYRTGVSEMTDGDQGTGYTKKNYASTLFYWTTAPDARTIEYYAAYDGVFPTKDPQDLFTSDIETVGRLDVEIPFHCDTTWREDWVKTKCETFMGQINQSRTTVQDYNNR